MSTNEPVYALFVGDKPSKTNQCEYIAFRGAKCWPRLKSWIDELGVTFPLLVNRTSKDFLDYVTFSRNNNIPVIALGKEASKALRNIPHFCLPHPSGLNRQINDTAAITEKLDKCRYFIESANNL